MPRPFREKIIDPVYWLEQAAHGWIGYAAGLPTAALVFYFTHSGLWAFVAHVSAAAIAAIVRELIQNLGDSENDIWDATLDAVMTWVGGILTALPWIVVWSELR